MDLIGTVSIHTADTLFYTQNIQHGCLFRRPEVYTARRLRNADGRVEIRLGVVVQRIHDLACERVINHDVKSLQVHGIVLPVQHNAGGIPRQGIPGW